MTTPKLTDAECDAIVCAAWGCTAAAVNDLDHAAIRAGYERGYAAGLAAGVPHDTCAIDVPELGIWSCKIGETPRDRLPRGCDAPMRDAVTYAYLAVTGTAPKFLFSGWGGELTDGERECVNGYAAPRAQAQERTAGPAVAPLNPSDDTEPAAMPVGAETGQSPSTPIAAPADDLVERLRRHADDGDYYSPITVEAADALAALRAENERLTRERDVLRMAVKDDAQWAQENERLARERDEWKDKYGDANIWGLRNAAAWKDRAERAEAALEAAQTDADKLRDEHIAAERYRAMAMDELRNIADADVLKWEPDMQMQFREWAQNRARQTLAAIDAARGEGAAP